MNVESWNTTSRLINHGQIRLGENPGWYLVLTCHNNTWLPSTLIISTSTSPFLLLSRLDTTLPLLCNCDKAYLSQSLSFNWQKESVCPMRIRTSNLFSSGQMSQGALPNFSHGTLVVCWWFTLDLFCNLFPGPDLGLRRRRHWFAIQIAKREECHSRESNSGFQDHSLTKWPFFYCGKEMQNKRDPAGNRTQEQQFRRLPQFHYATGPSW